MGRSEEPSEPLVGPLAEFAVSLQGLRLAAGSPPFDELGRRSEQPSTELAAAVSGRIVPSFPLTLAFVRACHGDEDEWALRWHAMQERLGAEAERAAEQQVAGQEADWYNVPPADEWLAMASSLPSGEPLPPDEPLIRGELPPPAQWRPADAPAQPPGWQPAPDDPAMVVWSHRQPDLGESAAGPDARRFMEPAAQPIIEPAAEPTSEAAAESVAEPGAPPAAGFPAEPDPAPMVERVLEPPVVAGATGPVVAGGLERPVVAGATGPPPRPAAPTPELWKAVAGQWPGRPAPPGETVIGPAPEPLAESATGLFAEPATGRLVEPGGPPGGGGLEAGRTADPVTPRSEPPAEPRDAGSAMPQPTAGSPPPSAMSPPAGPPYRPSAVRPPPPAASPSALPPLTPPAGPSFSRSAAPRAWPPLPPNAGPPYVPSAAPHYVPFAAPPYLPSAAPPYVRSSARTYRPPPLPSPDDEDFALSPMRYAEDQAPPPNRRCWDHEPPPLPGGPGAEPDGPEPPLGPRHAHPGPRHVQAGWRPAWPLLASALITVVAAGVGFGYLMSFHSGRVVRTAPSPHAASRHPPHATPSVGSTASPAASQHPGHATPSAGSTPGTATPGVAVFPALAGVGCAPSLGTSAVTGTRSQGGDGWTGVNGGLPACGGQAIATRKTGAVGLVQDTFTWTFKVGHPATCTAQIFIADANPSSGSAQYDVYGDSLAPGARIGGFEIKQATAKGQWVQEGSWQVRGTLSVQLTDAPAFRGDVYHVTASAAKANCS